MLARIPYITSHGDRTITMENSRRFVIDSMGHIVILRELRVMVLSRLPWE